LNHLFTPFVSPIFAIFAHGLAAFAFWRVGDIFKQILSTHAAKFPIWNILNTKSD